MNDRENDDKSIVEALSALGWVEEKDNEEGPSTTDKSLKEQLKLFIEQNRELNDKINIISKENEELKQENENLLNVNTKSKITIEGEQVSSEILDEKEKFIVEQENLIKYLEAKIKTLSESNEIGGSQIQAVQELKDKIAQKDLEIDEFEREKEEFAQKTHEMNSEIDNKQLQIQELSISNSEKDQIIEEQAEKFETLNETIREQTQKIEEFSLQTTQFKDLHDKNLTLNEQLEEGANRINELEEQVQYLQNVVQNETIHKSKYDKIITLVEKKDEIITEKEKSIFDVQNSLKSANQTINQLQQQVETFNLLKKDLEKKDERIRDLVVQIEEKVQNELANREVINRLEDKLENNQKDLVQYKVELNTKNTLLEKKEAEITTLSENVKKLNTDMYESEQIEDKILTDITKLKDEKLKFESELETKDKELIELKKKIKLMRRDLSKI